MKLKYSIVLIASLITFNAVGQLDLTTLTGDQVNNGDVFNYDTNDLEEGKFKFVIANSSSTESINVLVEVTSLSNTNGQSAQLCVQPICFYSVSVGSTYPNAPINLGPNQNNGPSDYFVNLDTNDSDDYPISYGLKFYTLDDLGNPSGEEINITYNYSPQGLNNRDFSAAKQVLNTSIKSDLKLNLIDNSQIIIYNNIGQLILDQQLAKSTKSLDLSFLKTGLYFIKLVNTKQQSDIIKIIKQ